MSYRERDTAGGKSFTVKQRRISSDKHLTVTITMTRQTTPDGDSISWQASTATSEHQLFNHRDKEKNLLPPHVRPPQKKKRNCAAGDNKEAERFTVGIAYHSHSRKKCHTPASTGVPRNTHCWNWQHRKAIIYSKPESQLALLVLALLGQARQRLERLSSGGLRADFLIAHLENSSGRNTHGEHQESRPTTAGPGNRRGSPSTRPADRSR